MTWEEPYRFLANGTSSGNAVTADADGNVYVAGAVTTFRSQGCDAAVVSSDFVTLKYAPQGGPPLWVATYDGPGERVVYSTRSAYGCSPCPSPPPFPQLVPGDESAGSLWLDAAGNVLVTGRSRGAATPGCTGALYSGDDDCDGTSVPADCRGSWDYATVKYSADGQELWVARFDGDDHLDDTAAGVVADGAGNVFVTGSSRSSATGADYLTVGYSPAGAQLWTRRYAGNGGDRRDDPTAIAIDGQGRVTVTGSIQETRQNACYSSNTARDIATIQDAEDGTQRWLKTQSGGGGCSGDYGLSLATTAGDDVIVGGLLGSGLQQGDYVVIEYDANGRRLWSRTYENGRASGAAIGPGGRVHAVGPPNQPTAGDGLRVLTYAP